jgi:CRISPR/Cas system-associated exonuclease Cas4 (RecB family)
MLNIVQKVTEYLQGERKGFAPACNYASQAGHPCARKLVYDRLNWQEKLLPEPAKLMIFREGNLHEEAVIRLLQDAGLQVVETQRPFSWDELQVRGRLDGRIKDEGRLIPLEVKSSNSYDFDKINTKDDLKTSAKVWIRGYLDQIQLYLLMANEPEGILLLKNKQTGQLKQIYIDIDFEYAEQIAKKLELVNKHVATKTYPERITDRSVCQYCDFRHICLPDEASEQINLDSDPELLELLEQRERLKDSAKEYEAVDDRLKEYWKRTAEGTYLVGGKYQVKLKVCKRTFCNPPPEIKKQYEESTEYMRATITKLQ